jgi:hypothetical protein
MPRLSFVENAAIGGARRSPIIKSHALVSHHSDFSFSYFETLHFFETHTAFAMTLSSLVS